MAILSRDRLESLLKPASEPCISIYLPTHRRYPDTEQDPIRYRNALREAERLLSDRFGPADIRELLDPVASLPTTEFWRHQADGLAVFRSRERLEEFRLPIRVPELVVVAPTFHVRPLIRCLNSNERYFLLALAQGGATVYQGSLSSLTPVSVPDLPPSLAEHRGARRTRTPSRTAPGRGPTGRGLRASGVAERPAEADLEEYFRAIDRALRRALRHDEAPVILAGVEYYLPIYRRVTRLKRFADAIVAGSPDAMSADELHARAWPVAREVLQAREENALGAFRRALDRGRATRNLEDIVRQARRGGVRRLFLATGVRVWGTVEATTGRILRTADQEGSHDDDILDDVAEAVLRTGGEVIMLPPDRMPEGREAAAELA